mmetsp:Transcript_18344/g.69425  ORF Transcript_18344/g.69425 Transcript_18344/m.69425 type:complete len:390 (-) Transcript_18344:610-1779(-)
MYLITVFSEVTSSKRIEYPTSSPRRHPTSSATRAATLMAATRLGCVQPIRPNLVYPSSRRYCVSCVVLPLPVSPVMTTTWLSAMHRMRSSRTRNTGRNLRCSLIVLVLLNSLAPVVDPAAALARMLSANWLLDLKLNPSPPSWSPSPAPAPSPPPFAPEDAAAALAARSSRSLATAASPSSRAASLSEPALRARWTAPSRAASSSAESTLSSAAPSSSCSSRPFFTPRTSPILDPPSSQNLCLILDWSLSLRQRRTASLPSLAVRARSLLGSLTVATMSSCFVKTTDPSRKGGLMLRTSTCARFDSSASKDMSRAPASTTPDRMSSCVSHASWSACTALRCAVIPATLASPRDRALAIAASRSANRLWLPRKTASPAVRSTAWPASSVS